MIRTLAMAAGLAIGASAAQAAFVGGAIVEGDHAAASATLGQDALTFQIFATFDGNTGIENTVLNSTFVNLTPQIGSYFNDTDFGNNLPPNANFFPLVPELEFDTYGTVGAATVQDGGDQISTEPGTSISSSLIQGGWFDGDPANPVGVASTDLGDGLWGVLLFNITLVDLPEGIDVDVIGNDLILGQISVFTADGAGGAIEHQIVFVPTPGAAALFGVAGLAAARRRR